MPEPVRRCALRPIFATLYPLYMLAGCPNYFETHKRKLHTDMIRGMCECECIVFQVSHVRIELNLQQNVAKGGCQDGAVCSSVCARLLSIFSNVFCSGQHTHTCATVCACVFELAPYSYIIFSSYSERCLRRICDGISFSIIGIRHVLCVLCI